MSSTKSPSLSCSNSVTDDNNGADQIDFSGVIDPALLALSHPTHNNNRSANDDDPTSLFVEDTESNQSSIDNLAADDDYDDDYDDDCDNDYDDTSSDFPETEANQSSTNNFPADADDEEADNSIEESDDDGIPVKKRKISGNRSRQIVKQAQNKPTSETAPRAAIKTSDSYRYGIGYNDELPPLSTVREWFQDLTEGAVRLGLLDAAKHLNKRPLRVATMCSGTESPLLALRHISKNLFGQNSFSFELDHLFSAEIVPYKQAFIERNFKPPVIFADITELSEPLKDKSQPRTATTAYGAKAIVPSDLDLLMAGFVCSDYSMLNNARKGLEDRGESGDTFYAIKDYAQENKPKIIILENVVSVPWTDKKAKTKERGLDVHFEEIGYSSRHLILDTKEFYVPQTRRRGYLIAIHRASFTGTAAELIKQLDYWAVLVKKLKRHASVPAERLLLKSDDPKLKFSQVDDFDQRKTVIAWERCARGHELYREAHKLGQDHPVTNWAAGGFKKLPDHYKLFRGATERVCDTIDISHLRCIRRGFDDRYWNRDLELSQNVYRITDTTLSGIMPCITPTGFPFSTVRGCGLTGYESLKFQAMDADTLDVTNLSQGDLRNLAGNAMTSTVVGAVISAGLIAFHKILDKGTGVESKEKSDLTDLETSNELLLTKSNPANHRKLPVRDAVRWASESRRLCYCEGRTELTTNKLQECVMCGHTTCISCGGNPKHLYSRKGKHLPTSRIQPFKFEAEIKKYIPMSICFNINQSSPSVVQLMQQMEGNRPKDIEKETWTLTIQAIKDALCSKVYFREIIRGESWHIHFSSSLNNKSGARLELVIADHNVEWYLYATASSAEPLGSRLRKFVEKYPCARMLPVGDDITKGDWELYMPELKLVNAIIKGHGNPVESYNTQIGLEDVSEVCISNKCSVVISEIDLGLFDQDISGEYEYSLVCGQAYSSLHVKLSTKGSSRPTFLFFDHEKLLRNPKEDSFIFTDDIRRLDYGEYRRTFGRLGPEHHPSGNEWGASESVECLDADTMGDSTDPVVNASTKKTTKAQKKGLKKDNRTTGAAAAPISDQIILLNESSVEQKVTIYRDGYWLKCPEISMDQLTQPKVQYQKLIETTPELKVIMCHSQQAIFTCTAEVTCEFSDRWVYDVWTELDKSSEEIFFKEFRWLLEQGLRIFDHCAGTSKWHPVKAPKYLCSPCAPRAPKVLWTCAENNKLAPFEDPSDARDYEHALKDRPVPLTVRYRIDKPANIEIKVGMDPITLVHRAWGQLALTGKTENISLSWRLITDDNSLSKPIFGAFTLLDSQNEQPAENPPGIIAHQLRPEQLRNLSWAINQESGLGSFTEEEIVEDRITHINYRAEGKAARKVPVTGGVLAHEVGFGKTLVMLALIDAQFQQANARESEVVTGSIPIKATMVLCPSHLTLQWRKEVRKFLPNYKDYVLHIDSFKDLKSFTIQDFQDAKIIIVNRELLNTELYAMAIARFAGMVELDTGASQRPFRCWYAKALQRIAHNLEALRAQPHTFAEYVSNQFEQDKMTAQSTQAVIPSKRLTGAAYMNKSSNAATKGSTGKRKRSTKAPTLKRRIDTFNLKKVTKSRDISKFTGPILELFSFARVVVDEYTYLGNDPKVDQKQAATILQSIKARNKWLLSGTPAISDFHDIQKMAEFIGINLGAKDYTLMKRDVLNREVRDMTRTEKFLMYRDSPSPAWQQHRHERAQDFLNHFVRKDIAQIGPIETIEQLVLIEHPAAAKAVYYELTQFLTDSGFDLTKRVRSENHKSQMINGALFQCQDVEEILLLRAASAHSDIVKDTTLEDSELCQKVVKIREEQYLKKKDELEKTYKLARRIKLVDKSSAGFYEGFIEIVTNNVLGDKETSDEIGNFILEADKEPVDPPSDEEKRPTLRQISTSMGTMFNKLVGLRRCWRFAETICYLQGAQANIGLQCSKCGKKGLPIGTLTVLGQCGHLVCSGCLPASYKHCSEPKCLVRNTQSSRISASAFISGGSSDAISKRSKIDHVVNLIETIPSGDKVIVFVQFPKLLKEVQEALEDKNINVCELSSSNRPTDVLEMFENEDSERVLILNIGDASAAGSNLTVANHVIFVAPYHTKGSNSQYTYDAAMTQAIGRARRFGQQKTVYIYHFLVKGTVDIDIMEFRTSRIVKQTGPDSGALVQGDREESEFGTPFYQYVSRDDD